MIGGFVAAVVAGIDGWNNPQNTTADCSSYWKQCADNSDLINNYSGVSQAKSDCEDSAERSAKYGDPKFPFSSFDGYFTGVNYVKTGVIVLEEDDAQFENIFGAMVHSTVTCTYDLKNNLVVGLEINPK